MYKEVVLRELWSDLDDCVYRLMTDGIPQEESPNEEWRLYGYEQGRALGLALAIAKIDNLSEPDIEAVRREAMDRWERYIDES